MKQTKSFRNNKNLQIFQQNNRFSVFVLNEYINTAIEANKVRLCIANNRQVGVEKSSYSNVIWRKRAFASNNARRAGV